MIRINLLPAKDTKRKQSKGPSGPGAGPLGTLFIVLLLLELGGMGYWYMQAQSAVETAAAAEAEAKKEVDQFKKIDGEIKALEALDLEMGKQRTVFRALENGKTGPLDMLLFLSYVLRSIDTQLPEDELKDLTDIWGEDRKKNSMDDKKWSPDRVWIRRLVDTDGAVVIEGAAKDHEDVMTFMRRLRSSVFFEGLDVVQQKVNDKSPLGQSYVEFKLKAELNYDPEGFPPIEEAVKK